MVVFAPCVLIATDWQLLMVLCVRLSPCAQVPPHLRQQILSEKPHLKRAFMQHVPANMSEEEFWGRYFRYCQAKQV
jgi:hypothetical protein